MYVWTVIIALATAAMAFLSWRLVVVNRGLLVLQRETREAAEGFQKWSKQRSALREEPELIIQGSPMITIRDHSALKQANVSVSILVSNPGELLTTLLAVRVKLGTVSVLGAHSWTWTSLFPMLSMPVTQMSSDPNAQKELLVMDSLPAPVFAGGLLKLESSPVLISCGDAEKLQSEGEIVIECEFRPGNLEPRSRTLPCGAIVDWANH